tara:strand:- start:5461 stop:6453 length:993 start_codon:yes stop_codon:yes gene_type:complete
MIVTDAWAPQVNGVVRTLDNTIRELKRRGHAVLVISPDLFKTVSCPGYPEIRLALFTKSKIKSLWNHFLPEALHIATEGPLGLAMKRYAERREIPYTTAYHTRFPEYLKSYFNCPLWITYTYLRWFHSKSKNVMVPTPTILRELSARGISELSIWARGVETDVFKPQRLEKNNDTTVFLYVGRISSEKNISAFLKLDLPGEKWVVGDGPLLETYKHEYPDIQFFGAKKKTELVSFYNQADVFVFPSKTDTFGLVMLEAMACGTPVAAYPVASPIDVIHNGESGAMDEDLKQACLLAQEVPRENVRRYAQNWSWKQSTDSFESYLVPFSRA